jgi:small GTP-binding protein
MPSFRRQSANLLWLGMLAVVGLLLMVVPSWLAGQYERAQNLGDVWGTVFLVAMGIGGVLVVGSLSYIGWTLWSRSRRKQHLQGLRSKSPSELTRSQQEEELAENLAEVSQLRENQKIAEEVRSELGPLAEQLEEKQQSQQLEIVAFGTISSGKSSLLNALAGREVFQTDLKGGTTIRRGEIPWPGHDRVVLVDTPGLGEIDGQQQTSTTAQAAAEADVVLMVVDGPLRESEFSLLQELARMEKGTLLCLNKEDWYGPEDQERLLDQIREQASAVTPGENVLAVRANPTTRIRERTQASGATVEETVEVPADISTLADRLMQVVRRDGQELLMANLLLQSRGLVEDARRRVEDSLEKQSWAIVDKYMWSAGGVAALSPFPLVDFAAGCAVSTKMVLDLAQIYQQPMDVQAASNLLGQMGKNLIAVLGLSAATPAVAIGVASLLKTIPGIGTIVGGALQGVVMALVTRWIGAVFIEYFQNEMQLPEGGLADIARRHWQRLTTATELVKLVTTARSKIMADDDE